jgi:hypothetical protein
MVPQKVYGIKIEHLCLMRASWQLNLDILTFSIPEDTVPEYVPHIYFVTFLKFFSPRRNATLGKVPYGTSKKTNNILKVKLFVLTVSFLR